MSNPLVGNTITLYAEVRDFGHVLTDADGDVTVKILEAIYPFDQIGTDFTISSSESTGVYKFIYTLDPVNPPSIIIEFSCLVDSETMIGRKLISAEFV
jgi:hypothetical protein